MNHSRSAYAYAMWSVSIEECVYIMKMTLGLKTLFFLPLAPTNIQHDEFQLWLITRQIGGATTKEQLQAAWKKLESKQLKPDDYLMNQLGTKCEEIGVTLTEIVEDSTMAAGG